MTITLLHYRSRSRSHVRCSLCVSSSSKSKTKLSLSIFLADGAVLVTVPLVCTQLAGVEPADLMAIIVGLKEKPSASLLAVALLLAVGDGLAFGVASAVLRVPSAVARTTGVGEGSLLVTHVVDPVFAFVARVCRFGSGVSGGEAGGEAGGVSGGVSGRESSGESGGESSGESGGRRGGGNGGGCSRGSSRRRSQTGTSAFAFATLNKALVLDLKTWGLRVVGAVIDLDELGALEVTDGARGRAGNGGG